MLFDRSRPNNLTITRVFKSNGTITCLHYGPYDNGHILIGMSTGDFIAFDSMQVNKIVNIKVSNSPVTSISLEPT